MSPRLPVLLAVLVAIVAVRWWDPLAEAPVEVVQPVVAAPRAEVRASREAPAGRAPADLFAGTRVAELAEARDAFAVRTPPPPPAPPPPPPPPKPQPQPVAPPVVQAPVVTAPAPPALQVIGTWQDERGLSVFVAGPRGVVQARVGDTVLTEYQIVQLSPQQLQLKHTPSQRQFSLAMPASRVTSR